MALRVGLVSEGDVEEPNSKKWCPGDDATST